MKFEEWLQRNDMTASHVAQEWGISVSVLSRMISGRQMVSFAVIIRSFEISNGEVTHLDWIETQRTLLVEKKVISKNERFSDAKPEEWKTRPEPAGKRGRGRPRGSIKLAKRKPGSGRKKGSGSAQGQQEHPAA